MRKTDELENTQSNSTVISGSSANKATATIRAKASPNISDSALLLRNAGWYLIGHILPILTALLVMPKLIHAFGVDRIGILSLGLSIVGFQTALSLGIDRASTKLLAEIRDNTLELGTRFKTSLALTAVLSILASGLLAAFTPFLATKVFNVPPELLGEARAIFFIFSAWLLIEFLSSPFAAVLTAMERFACLTNIRTATALGTYGVLLVGALVGEDLTTVLIVVVGWRFVCSLLLVWASSKATPDIWREGTLDRGIAKMYFQFGRWVALYSIISFFNMHYDRIALGSLQSAAATAYYALPFDMILKFSIVPTAVAAVLFPRLSAMTVSDHHDIGKMCRLSTQLILLSVWPFLIIVLFFAADLLRFWIGDAFAANSGMAATILALGMLVAVIKPVFWTVIEAKGRPDFLGKLFVIECIVNIPVVYVCIRILGVEGAAISFALRALAETAIIVWMAQRVSGLGQSDLWDRELRRVLAMLGALCVVAVLLRLSGASFPQVIVALVAIFGVFLIAVWAWVWTEETKGILRKAVLQPMVGRRLVDLG